jgi:2-methylisocitrate lyase-like PEP mutase family enzyme
MERLHPGTRSDQRRDPARRYRRGRLRDARTPAPRAANASSPRKAPCLLNFHCGGKTTNVDLPWVHSLGHKIAIVPGFLLRSVLNICEQILAELQETGRHPVPARDHSTRELFQKFGADEWDDRRERFRMPGPSRVAAE